ncbi:SKP1-like protein 9 [Linum perenne]
MASECEIATAAAEIKSEIESTAVELNNMTLTSSSTTDGEKTAVEAEIKSESTDGEEKAGENKKKSIDSEPRKTVTLKSSDGELFEVEESIAKQMLLVKSVLEDRAEHSSSSDSSEPIPLFNVSAKDLAVILEYLNKSNEIRSKRGFSSHEAVKKLGKKICDNLKLNDEIKSVLEATNYLELKDFLDVVCQNIADRISRRKVEFVREFFGLHNDFTPAEEAAVYEANRWAYENVEYDDDDED